MHRSSLADAATPQSPEADAIAATAPFDDLPEQVAAALAEAANIRTYGPGETIFAMGQFDGSEVVIVRAGRIKVAQSDPKTGSMLFEEVGEGEIFGLAAAISSPDPSRLAGLSLAAERQTTIVAIESDALRDIAAQRPSLTRNLMLHFARTLAGDQRASADQGSPERRVYAALAGYIERDAVAAVWRIERMPKHRELADRAGVDEADAASAVAKLIQSRVARRDYPGLIIDDMARLNKLAQ